jgi:hypothetical protein
MAQNITASMRFCICTKMKPSSDRSHFRICCEKKNLDVRFVAGQAAQSVDELGRDRFLRTVCTAIRMATRDRIVQLGFFVFTRGELHARQKLRFGLGGNRYR